ncbi:hypothetical protein ACFSHT_20260 [Paraburkholderia silviterrae]|uniref:hypothetical protein n=1 Tax=Paraburkholderia silviterrae TaxID=2528715 RepID=UPI001F0F871B|nr:hypothetical protein [Paraburkholderia silviterrae]
MSAAICFSCTLALAQSAADDANKSNNPLSLATSLNLQNYFTPSLFGSNDHTNDFLLRSAIPIAPNALIAAPEIFRVTVPVSTRPGSTGGYTTGLGDLNLFDIFLLHGGAIDIGAGPLITAPTATDRSLGTGKWQAGLAAVAINVDRQRLLGALIQWQHSFAGQSDRPDVQTLTAQPVVIWNLPQGWYVRSTGTWTFDLQHGGYYIPVGLGAGKTWKARSTIYNVFVEPQYSVAHAGNAPRWQIFAGLNMTLGK